MKVSEVQASAKVDEITLKIESVDEPREVKGGMLKVANATGSDDTGKIKLTLWNKDIDAVKTGDTIKITNGWATEYQGEKQLSSGKFGQIEVVESAPAPEAPKAEDLENLDEEIL